MKDEWVDWQREEWENSREGWDSIASKNNYRCDRCGSQIVYEDREVFFETREGLCGYCAAKMEVGRFDPDNPE